MARFEPGRTTAMLSAVCLKASFPALNVLFANRLSSMREYSPEDVAAEPAGSDPVAPPAGMVEID